MERQPKIKLISLMYNVNFENDAAECYEPACRHGQCICMDREQAGLLLGTLSREDTFYMENQNENIIYRNMQMSSVTNDECKITEGFFSRVFTDEDIKIMNGLIDEAVRSKEVGEVYFGEMLSSISAIYLTNSTNEISERDSLNYLCVHASCSQWYMDRLLRAVICGTVECFLNMPEDEWKGYAETIAGIFNKLNEIAGNYGKIREKIVKDMENYSEHLLCISKGRAQEDTGSVWIRNAKNMMDEYREKVVEKEKYSVCEAEKSIQWYRILMKIFEVMGMDTGIFPKLSFDTSEKQVSDYDIIIQVIGELKDDDQKRREVFEKIKSVFFNGKDITDEELIEELVVAAGYPNKE